jgi:hypothetical protein
VPAAVKQGNPSVTFVCLLDERFVSTLDGFGVKICAGFEFAICDRSQKVHQHAPTVRFDGVSLQIVPAQPLTGHNS